MIEAINKYAVTMNFLNNSNIIELFCVELESGIVNS